jgi:hypothetical protein
VVWEGWRREASPLSRSIPKTSSAENSSTRPSSGVWRVRFQIIGKFVGRYQPPTDP